MNVVVREASVPDARAIADLYYHTILTVNIRDYSRAQVEAWAGPRPEPKKWEERLVTRQTFVAVAGDRVLGFAEFERDGHIDTLYVHHEHQGRGVASRLLERIEAEAERLGIVRLYTEASITALPFFRKKGFSVLAAQQVESGGCTFRNFRMEKTYRSRETLR